MNASRSAAKRNNSPCRARVLALCLACAAPACASGVSPSSLVHSATDMVVGVCKDAFAAAQMPLEDLNIKRQPIPQKLQDCVANPYAMPLPPVCFNIQRELFALNDLLGPDMEPAPLPWTVRPPSEMDYVRQGLGQVPSLAHQHAVGMVRGKADIIPFRGVVRKITGAEKHAATVANAYDAGRLRRSFLKGLSAAYGCASTAP